MISLKLHIKALLLSLFFINNLVYCMEKKDAEIYHFDEQDLSPIETLPNELLFLIFYSKIDDIINTHNATQGKEEFKTFLSALRLTNRRFHSFVDELKRYFVMHKKPQVSDVTVNIDEDTDEYMLSFKINESGKVYTFTANTKRTTASNQTFASEITKISDNLLIEAGQQLAAKAKDQNDLTFIWSLILTRPYKKATDDAAKEKIRTLVKPIFEAFTNKNAGVYKSGLKEYQE